MDFPSVDRFIGDNITEGDFKVAFSQLLAALEERIGGSGSVSDAIAEISALANELKTSKQDALTPGDGISIDENVISSTIRQNRDASVGSIMWCGFSRVTARQGHASRTCAVGATVDGSTLRPVRMTASVGRAPSSSGGSMTSPSSVDELTLGDALAGTWMNIGYYEASAKASHAYDSGWYTLSSCEYGLFQRIA